MAIWCRFFPEYLSCHGCINEHVCMFYREKPIAGCCNGNIPVSETGEPCSSQGPATINPKAKSSRKEC